MKQTTSLRQYADDPLLYAQPLRRRVSRVLPYRLLDGLTDPDSWRATGISSFTKHVSKPPSNPSELLAYGELNDMGHLVIKSGWPDFMVVTSPDDMFVVEVKAYDDDVRPHQFIVLELLAKSGIDTYVKWP